MKRRPTIFIVMAILLFAAAGVAARVLAQPLDSSLQAAELSRMTMTDRIAGADRYQTAAAISQEGWEQADYAVLARGDHFADALCAGPLAFQYDGPILLTPSDHLQPETLAELKRLGVKHLFITGGLNAVSQAVEDELRAAGIEKIERLAGENRYETSVKIARKLGSPDKVFLATGNSFPDALAVSAIAARLQAPILLTEKDALPEMIGDYLAQENITSTYVVGGTAAVSDQVFGSLPSPIRLAGSDRYETNINILKAFEQDLNFEKIFTAVGTNFADALSGALLAAKSASPMVLTGSDLPRTTIDYLRPKLTPEALVTGLGGKSLVLTAVWESGANGPETGSENFLGTVLVDAPDVTLRNTKISGDLILLKGAAEGRLQLVNVQVAGKVIVPEDAAASLDLDPESQLETLLVYAPTEVTGQGRIKHAQLQADHVAMESQPDLLLLAKGLTANIGGQEYTGQGKLFYFEAAKITRIVSRDNPLPADYIPPDLVQVNIPFTPGISEERLLRQEAAVNLEALCAAAKKQGLILYGVSGYRSYQTQRDVFNRNVLKYGSEEAANRISARPGQSEHQSGLTMDVTSESVYYRLVNLFADTEEYRWLKKNAHHFGFIIRYPEGKEDITGYVFEPWHLRYVGKELAATLYERNITLDEYYRE